MTDRPDMSTDAEGDRFILPLETMPEPEDEDRRVDMVNHPPHYTAGGIECIDAIEAALGKKGFIAFLRGQVIKYQWRLGLKDSPAQEAGKANWYGKRLEEVLNRRDDGEL